MFTADRTKETSTTTGTGAFTLAGAVVGYQSFATAVPSGTVVMYMIEGQTPGEWEVGRGVFTSPSTLSRDEVRSSSNAGALVNFSAGTKNVIATLTAQAIRRCSFGNDLALGSGWALP